MSAAPVTALRIPCTSRQGALHLTAVLAEDGHHPLAPRGRHARVAMPTDLQEVTWVLQRAVDLRLADALECEQVRRAVRYGVPWVPR